MDLEPVRLASSDLDEMSNVLANFVARPDVGITIARDSFLISNRETGRGGSQRVGTGGHLSLRSICGRWRTDGLLSAASLLNDSLCPL